ncbi:MAG: hypothetical protein DRP29_06875 [Thermodesulfobacteriota bacterium]|nr:MAG: hypothetical protein DRP29_06875 [Thermodesulfobacteriota bacterium]
MQSLKICKIGFLDFVGQNHAKLALILNVIEPRCGGVLLIGKKGTGKSTLIRAFKEITKALNIPFIEIPINVTEESILGGIDLEKTIKKGEKIFQKGLLSKANGGFIYLEDINLFPNDILSLIFEVQARGENIIEREGITLKELVNFNILASMNPEEGEFSPHFLDRFGMCAVFEKIKDKKEREEIIKLNCDIYNKKDIKLLISEIIKAKNFLKEVKISEEMKEYIIDLALKNGVFTHRGEIFLFYAAKAYCAYLGEKLVTKEHIEKIAPLIFLHRKKIFQEKEEEIKPQPPKFQQQEKKQDNNKEKQEKQNIFSQASFQEEKNNNASQTVEGRGKEEIFPIGEPFKVKKLSFIKDRIFRDIDGRRTKTKTKGKGGRYVRSVMKERKEIAIIPTIRASAPYQKIRGKKDRLIIKEEDFRYKEKERKMRHTVIFTVDGSGSMGAQQRMIAVKSAIFSLLIDCYQKRDKVSMIVFRKDKAEIILPPTSSIELALKRLKEIPTGGKTPLSAGLMETYKLIKNLKLKEPLTRFIVAILTDGKANVSISDKKPLEEVQSLCQILQKIPLVDYIVIDTENKESFLRMNLALKLSQWLNAHYFTLESLRSDTIFGLISSFKKN